MNGPERVKSLYRLMRRKDAHPEVMLAIQRLILSDPAALKTYVQLTQMEVNLPWVLGAETHCEQQVGVQDRKERRMIRRAWFWGLSSSLSMGLLLAGLLSIFVFERQARQFQQTRLAATIEEHKEAVLRGNQGVWKNSLIHEAEPFVLVQGNLTFRTGSGVHVTLAAPAAGEFTSRDHLHLHRGTLIAEVPPEGIGFTVVTPGGKFVDLGTRFGVSVDQVGDAEAYVFQGVIATASKTSGESLLGQGEGVSLLKSGEMKKADQASFKPFTPLMQHLVGIASTSGTLQYEVIPPPSLRPADLQEDGVVLLLCEQAHTTLPQAVSVVAPGSGLIDEKHVPSQVVLPAGTPCTSFFLHAHTVKSGQNLTGTVRFDRPILGLIISTEGLFETDPWLGIEGVNYPEAADVQNASRGCVYGYGQIVETGDVLQLLPDGKSLSFSLRAGGVNFDQMRILVAAP